MVNVRKWLARHNRSLLYVSNFSPHLLITPFGRAMCVVFLPTPYLLFFLRQRPTIFRDLRNKCLAICYKTDRRCVFTFSFFPPSILSRYLLALVARAVASRNTLLWWNLVEIIAEDRISMINHFKLAQRENVIRLWMLTLKTLQLTNCLCAKMRASSGSKCLNMPALLHPNQFSMAHKFSEDACDVTRVIMPSTQH